MKTISFPRPLSPPENPAGPSGFTLAPPLQQVDRTYVRFGKRKLSYFGGCDYFRLSSDPRVVQAIYQGLEKYGLTVAASRVTTGNHELYERLEAVLAEFFDAPSALLFSSGYLSNLGAAQGLAGTFSHALLDEKAHASLVDAAPLLDCPVIKFHHRDPADVGAILQRIGRGARPILLTDGMFSHDGSIAPLKDYLEILPQDGLLLVDDAHGAGILGATGKGTVEQENVSRRRVLQTIALSKAFGVYGGAILCARNLRQKIQTRSRLFSGNTPLPLPLANGALRAAEILVSDNSIRDRLTRNIAKVKTALLKAGRASAQTPSPIIPLIPSRPSEVPALKRRCLESAIYPSYIKYPGGPAQGYFRFALSSEHDHAQLEALIQVFLASKPGAGAE